MPAEMGKMFADTRTAPFATRARCCEKARSVGAPSETPNPRNCEPAPATGGAGSQRQPPSKSARFKRAPRTRPYRSAAASPTLMRTPPPADLSTGSRA